MEIASTKRGGQKLLYGGYAYIKEKTRKNKLCWRCEKRDTCGGRMTTDEFHTEILVAPSAHTHPPDPARTAVIKAVTAIKQRAETSQEATGAIIQNCTQNVPLAAAGARMVRRKRTAPDGELEENMRTTRNEEFVSLHEDDITIFTTAENLTC